MQSEQQHSDAIERISESENISITRQCITAAWLSTAAPWRDIVLYRILFILIASVAGSLAAGAATAEGERISCALA